MEDLVLLCDLFYLPFEHGSQGLQLLQEFHWLKTNAQLVIISNRSNETMSKPEVSITGTKYPIIILYIFFIRMFIFNFVFYFFFRFKNGLEDQINFQLYVTLFQD